MTCWSRGVWCESSPGPFFHPLTRIRGPPPAGALQLAHLARGTGLPSVSSGVCGARAAGQAGLSRRALDHALPLLPSLGLTLLIFYYSFAIVGMEFFCGILYANCCK